MLSMNRSLFASLKAASGIGLVHLRTGDDIGKVVVAAGKVTERMYVAMPEAEGECVESLQKRLGQIYFAAHNACPKVDTLVFLGGLPATPPADASTLIGYTGENETAKSIGLEFTQIPSPDTVTEPILIPTKDDQPLTRYEYACMGGTFDRLHVGQKLLLSIAAYMIKPNGRLFCGIAGDPLFKEKALRELIEPCGRRERVVNKFVRTIRGDIRFETAELLDGHGPSIHEEAIDAIIVTEETKSGGQKCNDKRAEKGMKEMDVVTVGLVSQAGALTENLDAKKKLSSTGARSAMLGGLLDGGYLMCKKTAHTPYVIGLTGGIATGKTTASTWLTSLPEEERPLLINADALGHQAYDVGTPGNLAVRTLFPDVAAEDLSVDRKKLGALVFGDSAEKKENMKKLTDAVWPIIRQAIEEQIQKAKERVVVVEAAILVEAGWMDLVDEVWVTVAPPGLAKQRLVERNNLTEEQAESRIKSQMTGLERIAHAHVLVSNHSGHDALTATLSHAWSLLLERTSTTLTTLASSDLASRFISLAKATALPEALAAHWFRTIRDHYEGPCRDYHNLSHLHEMFSHFENLKGEMERPDLVSWAIFFHDVVYDAKAKAPANEKASAEMWAAFAKAAAVPAADAETVYGYIERTAKHHDGPAAGDLACFLDIDLGVLGRSPSAYAVYADQISLEYHHVPFTTFPSARAAVMESFVSANPEGPYFTATMQKAYGKQAIENVTAEIQRLKAM